MELIHTFICIVKVPPDGYLRTQCVLDHLLPAVSEKVGPGSVVSVVSIFFNSLLRAYSKRHRS